MTPDLTVRGAGIVGLACAFEAARRGARVRVIDPAGPGAGASATPVGALMPHAPDPARWGEVKAFQLASLLAARRFWPDVEAASGRPTGYARAGRLQPLADEAAVASARARGGAARDLWRGEASWTIEPAPEGWSPASPTGLVVRDTLSAHLNAGAACAALACAVRRLGGEVTTEGPQEGAVLDATGHAGLAALDAGAPVKGQAALMAHDAAGRPQIYAGGVHVVPHLDGTVGVGATTEREWGDPFGTDAALDDVVARAVAAVPALAGAQVIRRWAGLRPRSRTRAAVLGPWPGRPGWFVANGGFKIGLGLAPGIAALMADLILKGHDRVPWALRLGAAMGGRHD